MLKGCDSKQRKMEKIEEDGGVKKGDVLSGSVATRDQLGDSAVELRHSPPSTVQPSHPDSDQAALHRLDFYVAQPRSRESTDDVQAVDGDHAVGGPSLRVDGVLVDEHEKADDADVMQGEEERVGEATKGAGRGDGDHKEEDQGADTSLLLGTREEFHHLMSVGPLLNRGREGSASLSTRVSSLTADLPALSKNRNEVAPKEPSCVPASDAGS